MTKKLELWQEAIGDVKGIKEEKDIIVLTLEGVGDIAIDGDKWLISKLRKTAGQRIGILRTDIPGREYVLRKLT